MLFSRLLLCLSTAVGTFSASWIVPGAVWTDTSGKTIDAHGGMIYQRGATFYWIGQSASSAETPYMYSSTDLLNWTPLGAQNSIQSMWRPKIAKPNGSFWIYGQVNRLVQPLVSTQMVGGYATHGAAVNLPPDSYTYSDTGMFMDTDGTWYLLTSADHNVVQINKIASDGTIGARTNYLAAGSYEAPGLMKVGSTYFLIVSGKTGWRSNPNKMFWASSISGKWTGPTDIAPQAGNTYNSQNTFELTITGTQATTYIYMGDSWDSKGGPTSTYIWLPMAVSESAHTVTLQNHAMWKVDTVTGVVSYPATKKRYEAEDAEISGRAGITECNECISKRYVHRLDSESQVIFNNITGTGEPQWMALHYTVNNASAGEAHIIVNDQMVPTNISAMNSRAGSQKAIPIELTLNPGDVNTIRLGVTGTTGKFPLSSGLAVLCILMASCADFEIHLDGIEFFEDA